MHLTLCHNFSELTEGKKKKRDFKYIHFAVKGVKRESSFTVVLPPVMQCRIQEMAKL